MCWPGARGGGISLSSWDTDRMIPQGRGATWAPEFEDLLSQGGGGERAGLGPSPRIKQEGTPASRTTSVGA